MKEKIETLDRLAIIKETKIVEMAVQFYSGRKV